MELLLVEDSRRLRETVRRGLAASGFTVDVAADGEAALGFLRTYDYELVVLDLTLPGIDGLDVLRALARRDARPKVLVLSARDQVSDRVGALDIGADDYLVKPFAFGELLARLHALARRSEQTRPALIGIGDLSVDLRGHRAFAGGRALMLTPREFSLLALLARHRGRVFTRAEILERTAGSDSLASERGVAVLVFGLRRKLEAAGIDGLPETRRGVGYLIP
jgi:two-component system copper resistance phosphate regulon response regulator CusR